MVVSILWMQPSLWFSTDTKLHTIFPVMLHLAYCQKLSVFPVHHNSIEICIEPYAVNLELSASSNSIMITKQINKIEWLIILCMCMFTVISVSSLLLFLNKKISCSQSSCDYLTCNFLVAMSNNPWMSSNPWVGNNCNISDVSIIISIK